MKRRNNQNVTTKKRTPYRIERLEQRVLFSADVPFIADAPTTPQSDHVQVLTNSQTQTQTQQQEQATPSRLEVVIIDAATPEYQSIIDDLQQRSDAEFAIYLLDSDADGIAQIDSILAEHENVSAVHLIAHGADGEITLGNDSIDFVDLLANAPTLVGWQDSFTENGDFLIYGCDLASTQSGQHFVETLAQLTGTEVAASTDLTGSAALGGDWQLEYTTGAVETKLAVSSELQSAYNHTLATYTVSNTAANGAGSLHQAIIDANANANTGEPDTIEFSIGSGPQTIMVDAAGLPDIEESVILDATTQPGYSGTPLITLDGSATPPSSGINGITIRANDTTVKGFIVINFADEGIEVDGSTGFGDNNVVQGNWVGIDKDGNLAGVTEHGIMVSVDANGNQIGGTGTNEGNVVAGNGFSGIIVRQNADNNIIEGNIIGLKADGTTLAGNSDHGIFIGQSSDNNRIGGTTPAAANIIGGNSLDGIRIDGSTDATFTTVVSGTVVQGNHIGTDITGTLNLANGGNGIHILGGATNSLVGGTESDAGNLIAFNASNGVLVVDGSDNSVIGNDIHSNSLLSIDNNNLMASPLMAGVIKDSANTATFKGDINSAANTTYRIEFFSDRYLGFITVTTDGSGYAGFDEQISAIVAGGEQVTATATVDLGGGTYGDTSKLGSSVPVLLSNLTAVDDQYTLNEDSALDSNEIWFDSDWSFRRTISFDNSAQTENLSNFPVLIKLDATKIDYAKTHDQGHDLRFFDQDGTPLAHEIESWNEAGTSYVWVHVPQIDANSYTDSILMYYGNTGVADSGENSAGVWGDYSATYHLNENPGAAGVFTDSTGNFDATNSSTTNTTGFIGDAQDFNGTDQHINLGDDRPWINNSSAVTMSIWMNADDVGGYGDLMGVTRNDPADTGASRMTLIQNGDNVQVIARSMDDGSDSVSVVTSTSPLVAGQWQKVEATVDYASDVDNIKIYVDGKLEESFSHDFTLDAIPNTDSSHATIGSDEDGISGFFNGQLDEARITTELRSADWIAAQYASESDTFTSFGYEQTAPGLLQNDIDLDGDTLTVTQLNGSAVTFGAPTALPSGALLTLFTDGSFVYDPNGMFETLTDGESAIDTFSYTVADGNGNTDIGTVTMTIDGVNDTPTTSGIADITLNEDSGFSFIDLNPIFDDIEDLDSELVYAISNNTNPALFDSVSIDGAGVLTLDYAANQNGSSNVTIRATDTGGKFVESTFTVTLNAVNDAPVRITGTVSDLVVAEDSGLTSLGLNSVTYNTGGGADENSQTLTYEVVTIPDPNFFGKIYLADGTTQVTIGAYSLSQIQGMQFAPETNENGGPSFFAYQVKDSGGTGNGGDDFITETIRLDITPVNDDPVFSSPNTFNVNENATAVGTVTSTDVDGGAPQYSLVGVVDDGLFSIDSNTGVLTFNAAPDFEAPADSGADNVYNLTVQVNDGNGGIVNQNLTVNVINVNETGASAISDTDTATDAVTEDASIGDAVGITAFATDADTGDNISYSLDDDASGAFTIDANTGIVTVNGVLDYETNTSLDITVRATSTDTSFTTRNFTIAIGDVNDNPPVVTPGQVFNINEDAAVNDAVGTALATDADTVGTLQNWTITAGNSDGIFAIDANTGAITIANNTNLNFEATNQYTLTVQVGDGTNTSATQTLLIDINDVNEAPTYTSTPITGATEDTLYSYTVTANDVDGDALSFTGVTVPPWLILIDNGDGTATLSGTPTNADVGGHSIDIQVSDGTLTTNQSFTLTVANVNDDPVFSSPNTFNVNENATAVGTVTSTDVDGGAPQYSLVGVVDDGLFSIDSNTGVLTFNAAPDFEAPADSGADNVYNLTVQVNDGNGGIVNQNLTVNVINVNETGASAISDTDTATDAVTEDASIGDAVGITAFATDADTGDNISYSLDDDASGAFTIDANTGIVTVNGVLDYETNTSLDITVRATSTDTSFTTRNFTIAIGDVNDNPPVVTPGQVFNINEDAAVNDAVGTALATDADTVGTLQNWTITAGNSDGIFAIDANTGAITIANNTNLNFEATNQYTLTVQVGDGTNTSATQTLLIDINDVNEAPTYTSTPITGATEDTLYSYTVTANDVDGDALSFTGVTVPPWLILIDNGDGTATLSGTPTNADVGGHSIDIQVSDGTLTTNQSFTLTVANVNDDPVFSSPNTFNVNENATAVGTVTSTDVDGGAPQYSLVGVVDDGLFSIDSNTGVLTFNAAPDFEAPADSGADNVYNLTVQVNDGNGGIVNQNLTVNVINVNETGASAISDTDTATDAVTEDASIGDAVGITAFATDADTGDNISYSLDDDASGAFTIDANTGIVTVNGVLDYETNTSLDITVRATSTDTSFTTRNFTIAIGDVNDNPPVVTPGQVFNINEDAAVNDAVGTALATDADTVGTLQNWTITAGNSDGIFAIDANTGAITIANNTNLNFEATNQYTLTVQVGDGTNTSATQTLLIDINDVNEAPTYTSTPITGATEDTLYSYTVTANDVDGDALSFTGVTVPPWLILIDNGDGTATLSGTPTNADVGGHSIDIQVSDGTLTTNQSFTLTVANVNDDPVFSSPNTFNVNENATAVGTVTSTDVDGGAPQYSLVGVVDDGLFSIDSNTGVLTFNAAPDFEAPADSGADNVYNLTVQVNDGNGGIVNQNLTVNVINVNETGASAISDTDTATDAVTEDASIGDAVGITAFATDADTGDNISYSLDDDASGAFTIDANTGIVTVNGVLDYETNTSLDITVRATSTDTSFTTRNFTIAIGDVNDNPPVVTPGQVFNINEDAAVNDAVGTALATDADTVGTLQNWTITAGNSDGIFAIDANTGAITIANNTNLNFEATNQYTLTVQVGDGTNTSATQTLLIDINDVNEAPTYTSTPITGATEDTLYSYTVTANDVDGDALSFTGVTVPPWLILIDNGDGTATLSGTPTNADVGGHSIDIQVSDGTLTTNQSFTLTVANVNDDPVFSSPNTFNVNENATAVGTVTSTDVDGGAPQYSLVGVVDDGLFSIDSNTGVLTFNAAPDFEAPADSGADNVYNLTVQVNDGNGGIVNQNLTVNVINVNETGASAISDTDTATDAVTEDASIGDAVGITAFATDADTGDNISYSLDDDASGAFTIDANTGIVTVNGVLDYETNTSLDITVRATSTDTSFTTRNFTIAIGDVNDNPPVVTPGQVFNINEDAAVNDAVGTALATDADTVGTLQNWTITAGNSDGIFAIDANTGAITIANNTNLNFEATNQYTLTVQVGDGTNTSATQTLLIDINDVNEAPTYTSTPITGATEDTLYSYTVTANDVDGDALSFTGVTVPPWLILIDNGDGTATLSGTPTNADVGGHSIDIQVSDGTLTTNQSFTLTVANVNDDPVFSSPNTFNVNENATAVGTVTSTDVDGGAPQYSLVGVVDDGLFSIDSNTGVLTFNAAPDFEAPADSGADNVYNLTVQVNDGNGGIVNQNLTVNVINVNETGASAISDTDTATDAVTEDASIGDAVGITAFATDADTGDNISYSLDDDASGAFTIDANTGIVTVNGVLDYETNTSLDITVRATSTDTSFTTRNFTIAIGDVNEQPVAINLDNTSVDEMTDTSLGYTVGILTSTDPDSGETYTFEIVGGLDSDVFTVGGAQGNEIILVDGVLDFELQDTYEVTVRSTDAGGLSIDRTFEISVNDLNDTPQAVADTLTTTEDVALTIDVLNDLLANDQDQDGDQLTLVGITQPSHGILISNPDGTLTYTPDANYHGDDQFQYQITDVQGETSQGVVNVSVQSVNDIPTLTAPSSVSIEENSIEPQISVIASDIENDPITLSITGGFDRNAFSLDASSGTLTFVGSPDFENPTDANRDNRYEVELTVTDSAGASTTQLVELIVTNVNEAPSLDAPPITSMQQSNGVIGSVTMGDPDQGDQLTLTITGGTGTANFSIDPLTGEIIQHGDTAPGMYTLQVEVTDQQGATTQASLNITVQASTETPGGTKVIDTSFDGSAGLTEGSTTDGTLTNNQIVSESISETADTPVNGEPVEANRDPDEIDIYTLNDGIPTAFTLQIPQFNDFLRESQNHPSALDRDESQRPAYNLVLELLLKEADELVGIAAEHGDLQNTRVMSALTPTMLEALEKMRFDIDQQHDSSSEQLHLMVGFGAVTSLSLTAGFVTWLLRTGSLLATALSTTPLWRKFDPIPVLSIDTKPNQTEVEKFNV